MNIKLLLLTILAPTLLLSPQYSYTGGGQPPSKRWDFCVSSVFQKCEVGNIALNAVGDKVTYAINKLKLTENFKNIDAEKTVEITIPLPSDNFAQSAKLYAFTPTQGGRLIKDKQIKLLVVTSDLQKPLPDWTPKSVIKEATTTKEQSPWAHYMVKVYRQLNGEPRDQWTELGASFLDKTNLDLTKPLKVKMKIQPNAKITIFLPDRLDEQGKVIKGETLEGDLSKLS